MKLILAVLSIVLVSCGDDKLYYEQVLQKFEGQYNCSNNSFVELVVDSNNSLLVETVGQSLNTKNPGDGSLGTFPQLTDKDLRPIGNIVVLASRNYTYSNINHNIKTDAGNNSISGSKKTNIEIQSTDTGVEISYQIFDGTTTTAVVSLLADRTITCEKI